MKDGVVMNRHCTDVLMCIIFFIFFCGMFATAAYGYAKGDPYKLITPYDADGKDIVLLIYGIFFYYISIFLIIFKLISPIIVI